MDYAGIPALRQKSPGIYQSLKSRFQSQDLERICAVFQLSLQLDDWTEPNFKRQHEASFNPKPSRALHILLKCNIKLSAADCCTLIFACLTPKQVSEIAMQQSDVFSNELRRALQISKYIHGNEKHDLSPIDMEISGAILTDEVRHLHLWAASSAIISERFQFISNFHMPELKAYINSRLQSFFTDALEKCFRFLNRSSSCVNS